MAKWYSWNHGGLKLPGISYRWGKTPKKPHPGNLSRLRIEPGSAAWQARMLSPAPQRWTLSFENVEKFNQLGAMVTNTNDIYEEIKRRIFFFLFPRSRSMRLCCFSWCITFFGSEYMWSGVRPSLYTYMSGFELVRLVLCCISYIMEISSELLLPSWALYARFLILLLWSVFLDCIDNWWLFPRSLDQVHEIVLFQPVYNFFWFWIYVIWSEAYTRSMLHFEHNGKSSELL